MFDYFPTETRDEPLDLARCLFFNHGSALVEAAAQLGGACGEARVVSCARRIAVATEMTHRIRGDLVALHRLLSMAGVGDPDCLETQLFSMLDPASPEVETICLLTDLLSDVLTRIDPALTSHAAR